MIGDRVHLERVAVSLGIDPSVLNDVVDLKNLSNEIERGVDSAPTGRAAAECDLVAEPGSPRGGPRGRDAEGVAHRDAFADRDESGVSEAAAGWRGG